MDDKKKDTKASATAPTNFDPNLLLSLSHIITQLSQQSPQNQQHSPSAPSPQQKQQPQQKPHQPPSKPIQPQITQPTSSPQLQLPQPGQVSSIAALSSFLMKTVESYQKGNASSSKSNNINSKNSSSNTSNNKNPPTKPHTVHKPTPRLLSAPTEKSPTTVRNSPSIIRTKASKPTVVAGSNSKSSSYLNGKAVSPESMDAEKESTKSDSSRRESPLVRVKKENEINDGSEVINATETVSKSPSTGKQVSLFNGYRTSPFVSPSSSHNQSLVRSNPQQQSTQFQNTKRKTAPVVVEVSRQSLVESEHSNGSFRTSDGRAIETLLKDFGGKLSGISTHIKSIQEAIMTIQKQNIFLKKKIEDIGLKVETNEHTLGMLGSMVHQYSEIFTNRGEIGPNSSMFPLVSNHASTKRAARSYSARDSENEEDEDMKSDEEDSIIGRSSKRFKPNGSSESSIIKPSTIKGSEIVSSSNVQRAPFGNGSLKDSDSPEVTILKAPSVVRPEGMISGVPNPFSSSSVFSPVPSSPFAQISRNMYTLSPYNHAPLGKPPIMTPTLLSSSLSKSRIVPFKDTYSDYIIKGFLQDEKILIKEGQKNYMRISEYKDMDNRQKDIAIFYKSVTTYRMKINDPSIKVDELNIYVFKRNTGVWNWVKHGLKTSLEKTQNGDFIIKFNFCATSGSSIKRFKFLVFGMYTNELKFCSDEFILYSRRGTENNRTRVKEFKEVVRREFGDNEGILSMVHNCLGSPKIISQDSNDFETN